MQNFFRNENLLPESELEYSAEGARMKLLNLIEGYLLENSVTLCNSAHLVFLYCAENRTKCCTSLYKVLCLVR